jgi:hypothetical protein
MAKTYTEGYRIGFITTRKDITKKKVVNIRYHLGFERMIRAAVLQFEEMGLKPTIYRYATHALTKRQHHRIGYEGANPNKQYRVECVEQKLRIKAFGPLINHITPVRIKTDGLLLRTVDKHFSMTDGHESYTCFGDSLNFGINLEMQFEGTGYNEKIRLLGDYGSNLYLIKEIK